MNLPPFVAIAACKDENGGGRVDHVSVGASAKGEIVCALELDEVRERVVFAVGTADARFRRGGAAKRRADLDYVSLGVPQCVR